MSVAYLPQVSNPPAPEAVAHDGELAIKDVSKHFVIDRKPLHVLAGIDLSIRAGEFVSIVGRSGCGKSTLLRLIAGLDTDYSGEISLDGEVVRSTSLDRGVVFQDPSLLPWLNVSDNVGFALTAHKLPKAEKARRVEENVKLVGLAGFERALPKELSGGMAQRTAIARALVGKPKVLLLDEPLGALDALTRVYLQNELQRIWLQSRSTVIMVTHDVEEAVYLSDRIIILDAHPGRIRRIVNVPLPRPRDRTVEDFHHIKDLVLGDLTHGA